MSTVAKYSGPKGRRPPIIAAAALAVLITCGAARTVIASESAPPLAGQGAGAEATPAQPPSMPGVMVTPPKALPPGVMPPRRPASPDGEEGGMPGCRGPVDRPLELIV